MSQGQLDPRRVSIPFPSPPPSLSLTIFEFWLFLFFCGPRAREIRRTDPVLLISGINGLRQNRHYVAFIRKYVADTDSTDWVLFNDEKVAKAGANADEMKKFAYIYFLRRV